MSPEQARTGSPAHERTGDSMNTKTGSPVIDRTGGPSEKRTRGQRGRMFSPARTSEDTGTEPMSQAENEYQV